MPHAGERSGSWMGERVRALARLFASTHTTIYIYICIYCGKVKSEYQIEPLVYCQLNCSTTVIG